MPKEERQFLIACLLAIGIFSGKNLFNKILLEYPPLAYDRKIRLQYWKAGSFLQSAPREKCKIVDSWSGSQRVKYPSPAPPPQFEMTAGRSKCVTVSLSPWGSCQAAWKRPLEAVQDNWGLKGYGGRSWVNHTCQWETPAPRTWCWLEGEAATWPGRK